MNDQLTWVEALNINPEMLSEWSAAAPAGKPLLVWCLEQGYVSAAEYLQWASDNFGVPILSSAFFEQGGLDRSYFDIERRKESWSPWFFPVNVWDGLTHIACVELPPIEERAPNTCYVLADPRAMAEAWESTGTGVSALEEQPPPLEGPTGIVLETKKPFRLNLDETNLMIGRDIEPQVPEPLSEPEPPREETHLTRISAEPTIVGDKVSLGEETVHAQEFSPPTAIHRMPMAGARLNLPSNEPEALTAVFSALAHTYSHSCLVRFVDNSARLYKWSPSMSPPGNGAKAILNLTQPSFLRIVAKTLLPYHGYLVDSPTHQEFFKGSGLDSTPGCVTAVPIKVNGSLWGVLLAVGEESLQGMENLSTVVSATDQLITAIGPILAKAS